MASDIMRETYKTAEIAAALEHGNFTVFRRNLNSDKLNVLPPFADAGRGEYCYAQIAEMAIHLAAASTHTREVAHMVTWGILDTLHRKAASTPEYREAIFAFMARQDELEPLQHCPAGLYPLMLAPEMFFGEGLISRDPENRTWALYSISGASAGMMSRIKFMQEDGEQPLSLKDVRKAAYHLATSSASDERTRYHFGEAATRPYLLDLTGIFTRFEDILRFRLEARTAGRR